MPINNRHDRFGYYYQWGNHGAKYYYDSLTSKRRAYKKAVAQAAAAHAYGFRE